MKLYMFRAVPLPINSILFIVHSALVYVIQVKPEDLPETCRVSCQSKFGKLVHLVGFIIKKFIPFYSITRSWAQIFFNLE
jgi:hypothetical protein